jgi:ABC-type thiamine transport system ATPase subunit
LLRRTSRRPVSIVFTRPDLNSHLKIEKPSCRRTGKEVNGEQRTANGECTVNGER